MACRYRPDDGVGDKEARGRGAALVVMYVCMYVCVISCMYACMCVAGFVAASSEFSAKRVE